jgi:hypothetical protein
MGIFNSFVVIPEITAALMHRVDDAHDLRDAAPRVVVAAKS